MKYINKTENTKALLSNFLSLSLLQGVNYILPLITIPYLVRVLGVEYFGLLAFATAINIYFQIFTDYGFNLTATKEISINRENKEKVIEIFSSVMIIKFLLMTISFIFLCAIVFSFERFSKDSLIYFLTFGMVIGQVLFPIWFFQGMEKMKYITYINIFSKVISTIGIFIFVQEENDYYLVPLITSIGLIISSLYSLYLIKKEFYIKFVWVKLKVIKNYMYGSHSIFVANISTNFYTSSTVLFLGFFTNNTLVGFYSAVEKIILAISGIISPLSQTLYPYLSNLRKKSEERVKLLAKKIIFICSLTGTIIAIILFFYAEKIIFLIYGNNMQDAVDILKILSFVPLLSYLGNILGVNLLVVFGYNKKYATNLSIAGLLHIFSISILIYLLEDRGAAFSVVFTELLVVILMTVSVYKNLYKVKYNV